MSSQAVGGNSPLNGYPELAGMGHSDSRGTLDFPDQISNYPSDSSTPHTNVSGTSPINDNVGLAILRSIGAIHADSSQGSNIQSVAERIQALSDRWLFVIERMPNPRDTFSDLITPSACKKFDQTPHNLSVRQNEVLRRQIEENNNPSDVVIPPYFFDTEGLGNNDPKYLFEIED